MKHFTFSIIVLAGIVEAFTSCKSQKSEMLNSPLATVVKLNAAEAMINFEEAKKYQDINKIYSKHMALGQAQDPESAWREFVSFNYNLGKDKKFTNQFKYYDYDITEKIDGEKAEVLFKSKKPDASFRSITYRLINSDTSWIIVDIEYTSK